MFRCFDTISTCVSIQVNNILAPNPVTEHALGEDGLPLSVKKLYNGTLVFLVMQLFVHFGQRVSR